MRPGTRDSLWIPGVGVARHPQAGVGGENTLQAARRLGCAIGHDHLPGMDAIANAYAAAVVNAHPGGPAHRVDEGVEQRPVGNGVGAVAHGLGLAVRAGHRAAVQVVAANDNGGFNDSLCYHVVEF